MILYDIVMQLRAENVDLQGVKEHLAMYCEQFGDVRILSITERRALPPEQIKINERAEQR